MTKRQKIKNALAELYDFRYNTVTAQVEFREKGKGEFIDMVDRDMNSIIDKIDQLEQCSQVMFKSIVLSDFSTVFNPFQDYFYRYLPSMGTREGTKAITDLAATVTVPNPDVFCETLTRWLVASIANVFNPVGCQNHGCIVLTGDKGFFKTTWLNLLCPRTLSKYHMAGKITVKIENKDTYMNLTNKFIINLDDQLKNLLKADAETMKTIITHGEVSIRRTYGTFYENIPRIANFVASINGDEFLAESDERRYFPFRVTNIDINTAKFIDIDAVWLEAFNLYELSKSGKYQYWWDRDELKRYFPDLDTFTYATDEYELVLSYFDVPERLELANIWLTPTEVVSYLKHHAGIQLSKRKVSDALRQIGAKEAPKRLNGGMALKRFFLSELKYNNPNNL